MVNTPSSPSALPSLHFAAASNLGASNHGTLPDFIASIGSEVHTGLHFIDSTGRDEDMVHTYEGALCEENIAHREEAEINVEDMPAGGERQVDNI